MYTVKVNLCFSAAHNLRGYKGKCEALHGHNWKVELQVSSPGLDEIGMVCDFKVLKEKLARILKKLDHAYLNKLTYFKKHNPTSERIAEFIYDQLKGQLKGKGLTLKEVAVWETEGSSAIFSENA